MMNKTTKLIIVLLLIIGGIYLLTSSNKEVTRVTPLRTKSGTLAPQLAGIKGEINGKNISINELVGKKVVLVDFWTYSCINCQRTLPYLEAWYQQYNNSGLEIIGVHSPEFEFEKKQENVERAVKKWNITYPVVLDNDHETWNAFNNQYWPRKYLIDIDGYIVYDHIGEGGYDETEKKIQELLSERSLRFGKELGRLNMTNVSVEKIDAGQIGSPEIYLGAEFSRGNFGNEEGLPNGQEVTYSIPKNIKLNNVYLEGVWFVDSDHVRLVSRNGKVVLKFHAKNANIVASNDGPISILTSFVDKEQVKKTKVHNEDLYTVVAGKEYKTQTLELNVSGEGFKLFTFTFG